MTEKKPNVANDVNIYQDRKEQTEERLNNNNGTNNNKNDEEDVDDCFLKLMLYIFSFCQLLFFLEVIILTVYQIKSKDLQADLEKEIKTLNFDKKYFTRIYRDLIIVGYIFLFIFVVYDLYTLILVYKCGRRIKTEKNNNNDNNMENLEQHKYCSFFSDCLLECCLNMANFFHNLER